MIERHLGREAAVSWRLLVLFMLGSAVPDLPDSLSPPALVLAACLCAGLAERITTAPTCPRCEPRCKHETAPEPDPSCWECGHPASGHRGEPLSGVCVYAPGCRCTQTPDRIRAGLFGETS